jgi:AraC family transcriptional activator of pobA
MQTTVKHPVIPNDGNFFFDISTLESLDLSRDPGNEPIRQQHYQIVWITRGSGYFSIDLEKYRVKDNSIYTIPPGRFHQFMPTGPLLGYVLSFNIDFLYLAIEGPGRPFFEETNTDLRRVNTYLLKQEDPTLEKVLADIRREFAAHLMLRLEILSGLFRVFLIYMKRQSATVLQDEVSCPGTALFNSFYTKLDNQFRTMRQVADYASELSVTPGYLTDVVKKVTGYSASYHIQQRTVQEAKRLAMYSDANMKMVAYSLGFEDLAHFSKYFKNAAGMNFSDFRKKTFARQIN